MERDDKIRRRQLDWHVIQDTIRSLVRDERLILRAHALDKLEENDWTFDELVQSILNGQILDAESDDHSVDHKKYTILGDGFGCVIESVGKILSDEDGRQYVVITCY
jgi:hypothetical protein